MLEFTRARILEVELSTNTNNAANSVLTQYDPILFHEYGILAGEQGNHIDEIIQSSLDISFFPSEYPKNEYILDYFLFNKEDENPSKLMEPDSYEYSLDYEAFLESNYVYPKNQILDYMKPRQFYLIAEPFLEKLNVLSETSKSSKIIEEKSELISELEVFNTYKEKLMLYLDGIDIESGKASQIKYQEPYIRKIAFDNISYKYFPQQYHAKYHKNVIFVDNILKNTKKGIEEANDLIQDIIKYDIYDMDWENPDDEKKEDKILDLLDRLEEINKEYLLPSNKALKEIKKVKEIHEKALDTISAYHSMSQESLNKITRFQSKLEKEDQVIAGLTDNMNEELDAIKSEVDLDSLEFKDVNNLKLIQEQLLSNLDALHQCEEDLDVLIDYTDQYIIRKYNALKSKGNKSEDLTQFIDLFVESRFGQSHKKLENVNYNSCIENIRLQMKKYITDIFLDYREMNFRTNPEEKNKYEKKVEGFGALDLVKTLNIQGVEGLYPHLSINQSILPSQVISKKMSSADVQEASNLLEELSKISLIAKKTHEKILFNEYVVGMFSSIASQVDPNAMSLSGFALSDHLLEYEVEYVLGGHFDEVKNLEKVLAIIFGIRVLCNIIHLSMDQVKRDTILSIANAIAGWWTGGIGGAVLAIVIGLCWAMMESMIDVFMLTSGERVPFIKTTSTWYSSLDGDWEEFFNASVRRVQNEMSMYIKNTGEFTKDTFETIKDVLDQVVLEESISNDLDRKSVEESMQNSLNQLAEEMNVQIDIANQSIEEIIHKELDRYLMTSVDTNADINSETNKFAMSKELDTEMVDLISEMQQDVGLYSIDADMSLTEKVNIRETILNEYETHIHAIKEKTVQKYEQIYNKAADRAVEELKDFVDEKVKEGCEITTELLTKKADAMKKSMKGNITKETKKKFGIQSFIPSLSYKDYLRLLLLLDQQEENVKIGRVMDLIQMNIQKKYDDYDKQLVNYFRGVKIDTRVKIPVNNQLPVHKRLKNKLWEYHVEESAMY